MKVLVCGSRDWQDVGAIDARLAALPEDAVIIQGGAVGADRIASSHAVIRGMFVAEVPCLPDHWGRYGKRAGPMRNAVMLDLGPDLVLAFQRNGSRGTQHTIDEARRRGIPVEVYTA